MSKKNGQTGTPATLQDLVQAAHRAARAQNQRTPSAQLARVALKLSICEDILAGLPPLALTSAADAAGGEEQS